MRALFFAAALALAACAAALTPADRDKIAHDAAQIEHCQEVGRACKADGGVDCYRQYDDCMQDGGLR